MDKDKIRAFLKELEDEEKDPNAPKDDESKESDDQPEVSADVSKLVDGLGSKIVSAIEKATNRKADNELIRMVTPKGGLEGVRFPSNDKEVASLSKDDKIVTFFKALLCRKEDPQADMVFKALVEGTDALGGYLVPEELKAEVFRILPNFSVMRRIARIIPMQTDTLKLNTLTARPYAYWTAEYGSKSTTSAEFGQVSLTPNDLVCLLPVTHQLIADANIGIVQFIIELFAEAIAVAEDDAFFTGSGTGQPQGVASCSGIKAYAAGGVLNFDDIINIIYSLPQRVRNSPSASFVASKKVIQILRLVKDSQNRYIWTPGATSDVAVRGPEKLYGYDLWEQNDISQDQIYFGDWKYYIIGDRQSLAVSTTTEGGDAWRRNATEIKAVERVDGKCVLGGALVKATGVQS